MGVSASCQEAKARCCADSGCVADVEVQAVAVHPGSEAEDGGEPKPGESQPGEARREARVLHTQAFPVLPRDLPSEMPSMTSASHSHFHLDSELLRGIPLSSSLHGLGRLWLQSPVDLPDDAARASLWERSSAVSNLDVFLSHTWHTPGSQKVRALLVQSGFHCFLIGWLLGVTLFNTLELLGAFPSWYVHGGGPSSRLGGFLGSVVGLLASPYLPQLRRGRSMCFLDVVCINQADNQLMQRGIYGLGGFLASASELRILWSRPYLSRLWCIFELAAFRKANPSGKIVLKPLFVETGLLYLIPAISVLVLLDEVRVRVLGGGSSSMLVFCVFLPVPFLLVHHLRRLCGEKRHLVEAMRTFELAKVDCRKESDREFIYAGIRDWYGSEEEFEHYVRGPLSDEIVEPFLRLDLPVVYWLMALSPIASLFLDTFLHGLTMLPTLADKITQFMAWVVACPLMFMNIMHLIFYLCDYLSHPLPGVRDYGKTGLIWLTAVTSAACAFQLASLMDASGGVEVRLIFFTANVILSGLLWYKKGSGFS